MDKHAAEGILLTGVYGSGKSSAAVEIAYLSSSGASRTRCSTWTT